MTDPQPGDLEAVRWLRDLFEANRQSDLRYFERVIAESNASVRSALDAAEKAVGKAEVAQQLHNAMANEFRGQLSDQAATFMPRSEFESQHTALLRVVADLKDAMIERIDSKTGTNEKAIVALQEAAAGSAGKSLGVSSAMATLLLILAGIGSVVGIAGFIFGLVELTSR